MYICLFEPTKYTNKPLTTAHLPPALLHTRYLPRSSAIAIYTLTCRLSTALHSFCIQDWPYTMLSINCVAATHNITYSPCTSACTTHSWALPKPVSSTTFLCTQTNTSQKGTRCRDGVKVLWCCSHLVCQALEVPIPTCACFHSENFFVTCKTIGWSSPAKQTATGNGVYCVSWLMSVWCQLASTAYNRLKGMCCYRGAIN